MNGRFMVFLIDGERIDGMLDINNERRETFPIFDNYQEANDWAIEQLGESANWIITVVISEHKPE